ncbi:hypothetical protein BHM03_00027973 [Ensete ventricosum]|nr:hypothetical protein BHM03_00027973 [Ensete ventricosum]
MKSHSERHNKRMYYRFHREYSHDTEECRDLQYQIVDLIRHGHLHVDLAATSPCPWTVSPLTWPTRRVGVGLTQAWKGQPLYDRPDKGKVGKIDIPNCKKDGACLAARTMDGMVRYDGMVSNKEDKGLKYEHPQSLL